MKTLIINITLLLLFTAAQAQISEGEDGKYYADNNTLYNGTYTEFFVDGTPKLEMKLKNGLLNGTTMLYFKTGKVKEVRSYLNGKFHGTCLITHIIFHFVSHHPVFIPNKPFAVFQIIGIICYSDFLPLLIISCPGSMKFTIKVRSKWNMIWVTRQVPGKNLTNQVN
jgi:hypothetical protein